MIRDDENRYTDENPPKVGDIVRYWTRLGAYDTRTSFGKVTNVTAKGSVTVQPLGGGDAKVFRRPKYGSFGIKRATALQIARLKWRRARPKAEFVSTDFSYRADDTDAPYALSLRDKVDSAESARKAAAEMLALAEWWASEPKERT